jgi:60 kDa SS-A/Ro ribonucleoprotein
MARSNLKVKSDLKTHEGAQAHPANAEQQLRRSVLSCLLWEDEFYEDGQSITERIVTAAKAVPVTSASTCAMSRSCSAPFWRKSARAPWSGTPSPP